MKEKKYNKNTKYNKDNRVKKEVNTFKGSKEIKNKSKEVLGKKVNFVKEERLQKYIASTGLCSRRKADELIEKGLIKVNGKTVLEFGTKVNPGDVVEYNGKKLIKEDYEYYIINKPVGYVTTNDEQFNRPKVVDLIKTDKRLVSAGRLDMYTSGALIFSNDGEYVNKITHPSNNISKTYEVVVKNKIRNSYIEKLKSGIYLDDGYKTKKARAKILEYDPKKNTSNVEITISEGKNRQVRRMFEALNLDIISLHRSHIGNINIKDLKSGDYRHLNVDEIE